MPGSVCEIIAFHTFAQNDLSAFQGLLWRDFIPAGRDGSAPLALRPNHKLIHELRLSAVH
jgi:hypothetical protein